VAVSLGVPSDAQVVGVVANYRPVKDLALFLKSAHIVAAAAPQAAFLLVGRGELRSELEKLAVELGIGDRVFFSDGRGSVPDYLARMSVACLSSLSEGLPNAILEYMAAGLPVVATDVGGNSELVADGDTGYLVRGRTPEAFAEPIIRLLRDHALRAVMGQKGLERARTEFDLSAAVRRLEGFYISAVENARAGAGAQSLGAIDATARHR
jgi:glycosyltransferase involved in cell wall biosynthesis